MVSLHVAEQRLYKKLESGDHYEAQQQVLTVYRRLLSKGDVEESWGLLETAIAAFLEFEQVSLPTASEMELLCLQSGCAECLCDLTGGVCL